MSNGKSVNISITGAAPEEIPTPDIPEDDNTDDSTPSNDEIEQPN